MDQVARDVRFKKENCIVYVYNLGSKNILILSRRFLCSSNVCNSSSQSIIWSLREQSQSEESRMFFCKT